jgi:hypothetical protein
MRPRTRPDFIDPDEPNRHSTTPGQNKRVLLSVISVSPAGLSTQGVIAAAEAAGLKDRRTSFVEKHNQSMRQHMRRFTRLSAGHSKKLVNHIHMVALYTVWYNYARINSAVRMAPAMAAGISERLWDVGDIVRLIEPLEA